MTLVTKVGLLSTHDSNISSLKDYLGNLEEFNYVHSLLNLLE